MKLALLTNSVSPHQLPLAAHLARQLGMEGFRYIATDARDPGRAALGWDQQAFPSWCLRPAEDPGHRQEAADWAGHADVVLCGRRDPALFRRRSADNKCTLYMSERWFKQPLAAFRLLHPPFFRLAHAVARQVCGEHLFYLPIGRFAASDMRLICRATLPFAGLRRILAERPYRLWGYFVEPGASDLAPLTETVPSDRFRILWFGRYLGWKRTELLLEALHRLESLPGARVGVRMIGMGPEEPALRRLCARLGLEHAVTFLPPKPIAEIRPEIRQSDVCVVTSNAREGWGVAVNEGLIEGCCVVASAATGAGQTLIRDGVNGLLFRSGDAQHLARQLQRLRTDQALRRRLAAAGRRTMVASWTPAVAAERLLAFAAAVASRSPAPRWEEGPLSIVS